MTGSVDTRGDIYSVHLIVMRAGGCRSIEVVLQWEVWTTRVLVRVCARLSID